MAGEIATAYVSLVASTSGLGDSIKGKVGSAASEAGKSGGSLLGSNLISGAVGSMDQFGGKIVDKAKSFFKVGMAGVGAVAGTSLWGGLQRILNTEDAKKMFSQLGLGLEDIDSLMGDLQESFRTGPFAYPDVYNISSQLMASGVAMNDLVDTTAAIGNMAAFAGKDLSELAPIMTAIAGKGKLSAAELNRMGQMGIPIRDLLANALEISTEELGRMVTEGDLTSDKFFELIQEVDEFDGAMESFASTTRGAWSVMKAGLAGVGEAVLNPWFGEGGTMVKFLGSINDQIFGSVIPAFTTFGETIADWLQPRIEEFGNWVTDVMVPTLQDFVGWMSDNKGMLLGVGKAAGVAAASLVGMSVAVSLVSRALALSPIGIVLALASGLVYAYQNSQKFRDVVNGAFDSIKRVAGPAIDTVSNAVGNLIGLFGGGGGGGGGGNLPSVLQKAKDVFDSVVESMSSIFTSLKDLVEIGVNVMTTAWERFGSIVLDRVESVFNTAMGVVDGAFQFISGILDLLVGIFTLDFGRIKDGVTDILGGLLEMVKSIFTGMLDYLKSIGNLIWQALSGAFNTARDRIKEAISAAVDWVRERLDGVMGFIGGIPGRIATALSGLFSPLIDAATKAKDKVIEGLQKALDFVKDMPGKIKGFLANVADIIAAPFRKVGEVIRDLWNSTVGGFSVKVPDIPGLPGRGKEFKIPEMHTGGWVPGGSRDESLALLQGGEYVLSRAMVADMNKASRSGAGSVVGLRIDNMVVQDEYDALALFREAEFRAKMGRL